MPKRLPVFLLSLLHVVRSERERERKRVKLTICYNCHAAVSYSYAAGMLRKVYYPYVIHAASLSRVIDVVLVASLVDQSVHVLEEHWIRETKYIKRRSIEVTIQK